uniref:Rubisco LSMT substrate-binding domain-containing protein n=2 Tax=Corethron hystrix TaxID=216773 RepID=A0A7S1B3J4_9STRA|mmetsp:Transcript_11095/g.24481  ORF Transcript_11095/g.24481 Transcript_11095/m.24481 type:complete len:208 (+) Transcript_11095:400-1023(+)
MCNHGDPPVNTRHGLAPWGDFVVYADAAIPAGEEILITYGRLPNRLLLAQFGFLLPGLPERALASDAALVRVDGLFDAEEGAKPATAASEAEAERRWEEGPGPTALGNMARNAIVRRKEDGRVARWQPATLARKAAEHLGGDAEKQFGGLLERELGAYSTTLEEDEKELARGGASARKRLALQFRIQSKRLLQRELDMLEPGIGSRA